MLNRFAKHDQRYARRMARIERWDRPLEGWAQRLQAWINMLFVDHGIFRLIYLNTHQVTPLLWRSAQPSPYQLARFARQGIRTVVTLRGGREHGSWPLEKEACEHLGLDLIDLIVRSREAPSKATLMEAQSLFARLDQPFLVHCKSGADRAGFVAALYLTWQGRSADEALRQLSMRYGHFRFAKTGILDAFFEAWRDQGEAKGLSFSEWVATVYDPEQLKASFRPHLFSSLMADTLMRRE